MINAPDISIVIPVYNRAQLLLRAVKSCLRQAYADFEVVVVDDASTDGVEGSISELADDRVRLIRQPTNRGPGPARNAGADVARGEWLIFLDSDDELLPGALVIMAEKMRSAPPDVSGFRFMCSLDTGVLSPEPPLSDEVWDYRAYIRWAEKVLLSRQETLPCVRRCTFQNVRYPEMSGGVEMLYHLDFAQRYLIATSSAVVLQIHFDAGDQLTRPDHERSLSLAADHTHYFEKLLERHCEALKHYAPAMLAHFKRGLATQRFLAADRIGGIKALAELVRITGPSVESLAILFLGLAGPRPLARARARRWRPRFSAKAT